MLVVDSCPEGSLSAFPSFPGDGSGSCHWVVPTRPLLPCRWPWLPTPAGPCPHPLPDTGLPGGLPTPLAASGPSFMFPRPLGHVTASGRQGLCLSGCWPGAQEERRTKEGRLHVCAPCPLRACVRGLHPPTEGGAGRRPILWRKVSTTLGLSEPQGRALCPCVSSLPCSERRPGHLPRHPDLAQWGSRDHPPGADPAGTEATGVTRKRRLFMYK